MYPFTDQVFIIAELSANHNNDFDLAVDTIKAMAKAGANAVKVQTYTADSLAINIDNDIFGKRKDGLWKGRTLWDLYKEASMPYEWHEPLQKVAQELGLVFFSSPFDLDGVALLEELNVPLYKIASFEITDIPLIRAVAKTGKPIIISTGVAQQADIALALETCHRENNYQVTLLKCTSNYPSTLADANLKTMVDMRDTFDTTVGVSDHTMGSVVPVTAAAMGARVIEKHFILDRALGGPDSAFSMEPGEFTDMVKSVRQVELALGNVTYEVSEKDKLRRRSLYASVPIEKGQPFTHDNVKSLRTGFGLAPQHLDALLSQNASRAYSIGDPILADEVSAIVD